MADSILRLKVSSEEYDNKLKRATEGLNRYVSECRKVGGTLEVVEKETLYYVRALGQMDTVSKTATGKMAEMKKTFTELAVQYRQLTNEEKNSPFGKALAHSLDQLKVRINETKADLNSVTSELNGSKFGQFGSVIDTIGQKMGITGNLTEMLTSKTALMTTAIGAGAAAAGKAAEMWASYNSELAKQDQVVTVTTGLRDGDAERMTDAVRAIAGTYNVDFREAVNAANTLMTQFGKTGDEAIQLLRDGMQGMIQGDGGKLLSMIQQYAPSFRDAGIEASQLVAIIQNSEGGLFTDQNMNAIVMGIKNIRLMTNATSEALQKIGIDSEEMTQKLNSGSMTIFDAMRQVSNVIENTGSSSQAAGEVMQQVFGRQGAMAGTKLGEAIANLNTNLEETKTQTGELGNAYRDLEIANENLNKAIRDCFEYDGWEVMKTEIETGLVNALSDVLNSCRSLYGMLEDIGALKVFEFISGSILQCIRPFRELYNYAKLLFDELGGGTDAPKPKAGVTNLADDPNVDDNGNYKVKNVKNKNKKRLVSKPGEPVRYEGSTAPVDTGANPVKPLKPRMTATSSGSRSNTKKEQTELQQNQKRINDLTQKYVDLMSEASRESKPLTNEQRDRAASIKKEIRDLERRNGQLKLYQEQAKGKFLGSGAFKQQLEVDVAVNNKKIEELERQLINLDGISIDPKSVTITATDEALPKLREIEGITIDDKTMTVTADTMEALQALQGIGGVTIDPKTVTITATDESLPKLREIQGITIDEKAVAITADDKTQPEFREVEGIRLKGKKVTVTADTMEALRAVHGINGISIDPKTVTITATDEALPKLREIQGITIDDKTMTVTAETADALRALQGIEGITIDPKTVTITATDEALPKLREIQGITIDEKTVAIIADDKTQPEFREVEGIRLKGKKVAVTADTMEALRAVQGINGITIDPKTVTITATDEALPKLREIQGITIDEKTVAITADDKTQPEFREVEGIRLKGKKVTVTADTMEALRAVQGINGITIDPKTVTITATDESLPKLREIQGITIDDKTMTVTAETADALRALQGIEGVTIDPKTVTITATDEAMPKLREIQGITIDEKTVAITADDNTQPEFREVEGIKLKGKKVTVTADTQEALQALQGIEGVTVDTKTVKVTAETDEARQKVEELKRQIAELKDQNIQITAAMGSIGMPLSETPRMGVTDVAYGKGKNQFVPPPVTPTMNDVVRQRGGNLLNEKAMKAVQKNINEKEDKRKGGDEKDAVDVADQIYGGVTSMVSSLQQMGIELPEGLTQIVGSIGGVIGLLQSIMMIVEGIQAIQEVGTFLGLFANGGVVPKFAEGGIVPKFADGGLVGRAALGIAIPGNSMSGDNLRLPVDGGRGVIGVNSGEVILNRAQQGVIASALDGGGAQDIQLSATIRGEDIRLAINNNGRRTGRGEYVQSTRRR